MNNTSIRHAPDIRNVQKLKFSGKDFYIWLPWMNIFIRAKCDNKPVIEAGDYNTHSFPLGDTSNGKLPCEVCNWQ